MPFRGLCNRLVVTSTHGSPHSRAERSRARRPTARSCLLCRARLHASVGTSSPQAPKNRCRSFDPGWQHAVRRATNCSLSRLPGGSSPCPGPMTRNQLVRHGRGPVEIGVLTPHVVSPRPLARTAVTPRALLHSRCANSARFRDPRAPFIDMSFGAVPHRCRRATFRRPPLLPLFGHTDAASDTRSRARQCSLDPRRLGYSPRLEGPRAARRLLQSRDSVSTPTEDPSPASSRQAVHPRSPAPCATPKSRAPAPTAGLSTGQGPAFPHREHAFGNPRRGDRSPHRGIDPNPIDPDTPVANS